MENVALFVVLLRVPLIFLMDFIFNSKHCVSLDGWLICTKLLYFIWNIPKPSLIINNLPTVQDVESLALTIAGIKSYLLITNVNYTNTFAWLYVKEIHTKVSYSKVFGNKPHHALSTQLTAFNFKFCFYKPSQLLPYYNQHSITLTNFEYS